MLLASGTKSKLALTLNVFLPLVWNNGQSNAQHEPAFTAVFEDYICLPEPIALAFLEMTCFIVTYLFIYFLPVLLPWSRACFCPSPKVHPHGCIKHAADRSRETAAVSHLRHFSRLRTMRGFHKQTCAHTKTPTHKPKTYTVQHFPGPWLPCSIVRTFCESISIHLNKLYS